MKTRIINSVYCFGAVLVVAGAWAKIEHLRFADTALTIGLLTEAGIFLLYGLQELVGKIEQIDPGHAAAQPNQNRLIGAIQETNAILRDVYKTNK